MDTDVWSRSRQLRADVRLAHKLTITRQVGRNRLTVHLTDDQVRELQRISSDLDAAVALAVSFTLETWKGKS